METTLTVSQLNSYVKAVLSEDALLCDITVSGEISNFKRQSSGHMYFTLKDDGGAISCAMFKWQAQYLSFFPESGMKVMARGKVTIYEPSGTYQLVVASMQTAGTGELYAAFEKLKKKLEKDGLFDESRKKQIPAFPGRIGVVTSKTGAAVQDIINITGRRCPMAEIVLCPVAVQGAAAPDEIVKAIELLNRKKACDVMIVGRGGGSIEDLWGFNSEKVARAVAASGIPVISAVGHETDFTICDFAADLRAPTPSAAAELAVPDISLLSDAVEGAAQRMTLMLRQRIAMRRNRLSALMSKGCFSSPYYNVERLSQRLDSAAVRIEHAEKRRLSEYDRRLSACAARLSALDPMRVLSRGYCAVFKDGGAVSSAAALVEGDTVSLRFSDGQAGARIESTKTESTKGV